jgi:23S rRNA pseudouridine2605 synthase
VAYAVNKPVGVLSTARDTHGRPTVLDLLAERELRLYPVGRLDRDSSGLILLTNDGELANRLTHPSFQVPKTYRATVAGGPVRPGALDALRAGVELDDGPTAPAIVRRIASAGGSSSVIELTISEGRNRQVRRMCAAVGHPVVALERIAFGPLHLAGLRSGAHRELTATEIGRLRAL